MAATTTTVTRELLAVKPTSDSHLSLLSLQSESISITLPTQTEPRYDQKIIGTRSSVAPELQEFRGIPYGTISARWKHSSIRTHLPKDVFDATRNGPRCPQPWEPNNTENWQSHLDFPVDVAESEFDCLNLFVVRPSPVALAATGVDYSKHKLPVYFYIHGGGYAFGAGTDPMWGENHTQGLAQSVADIACVDVDPARLVSESLRQGKPIAVVNINYRLHLFGFAASSEIIDSQCSSDLKGCNFGLGDQRIALKWVAQNIGYFGGDPDRITIGGQSAGAISSHAHVLGAKFGQGQSLFRRAIIQSAAVGTLGPTSLVEANLQWDQVCKQLQLPSTSASSRLIAMSQAPPHELVQATRELSWAFCPLVEDGYTIRAHPGGLWTVHLERDVDEPADSTLWRSVPIDVLIGDTDVEASIHSQAVSKLSTFEQIRANFETSCHSKSISDDLLQCYGLHNGLSAAALQEQVTLFLTDVQFGYPVEMARDQLSSSNHELHEAKNRAKLQTQNIRLTTTQSYRISFGNPFQGEYRGIAQHCVDLIYLYDAFHEALMDVDERDQAFSCSNAELVHKMQSQWISFIANNEIKAIPEHAAIVYGKDRSTRVVSMVSDPDWIERKQRFSVLRRHWPEAQKVVGMISSM